MVRPLDASTSGGLVVSRFREVDRVFCRTGRRSPFPSGRSSALGAGLVLAVVLSVSRPVHAAGQAAAACDAPGVTAGWPRVHVLVTGVNRVAGNITLTMYGDQPAAFLAHKGSLVVTRVMLAGTEAEACLAVSEPGIYALAIYHDANNNHHFDRTLIGLPAEGYGFSNDAPTLLGPPAFSAARFTVEPGGTRLTIRLRY